MFIVVVVNFVHLYLLFCNIILYVAWFCYVFMHHVLLQLDVNGGTCIVPLTTCYRLWAESTARPST